MGRCSDRRYFRRNITVTYERLAYVYDYLMNDVPYSKWLEFLKVQSDEFSSSKSLNVLDLACGTGELTVLLAENGFRVTGVDLSEDMLMVASEKAASAGVNISLFHQDMSTLEDLGLFDIVTIFCDSLNYLSSPEEVQATFRSVYDHLEPNGLFLFDVHSPYKMNELFINKTFAFADEEVSYIWDCFPGDFPHSVEHELSIFVLNEEGKYERFNELHKQRTYDVEEYKSWLQEAGFSIQAITADFSNSAPNDKSERIFFTCSKI